MSARTHHKTERTLIGSGECFIALMGSDGSYESERYLGNTPGAGLTTETEEIEVQSSDGPVAETLHREVISRKYTFNLTLGDISHENLQLFTGGAVEDQTATTTVVTNEAYEVQADRWIFLGQSSSRPGGVGKVTVQTISTGGDESGATGSAADIKTDTDRVVVDADSGRLYIPRDSNLDGKWIAVDYTHATVATKRVKVGTAQAINGAFRYQESANPQGTAKPLNYYARLCSIRGDGEDALKSREGPQRLNLVVAVTKPAAGWPLLSIEGEAQPAAS